MELQVRHRWPAIGSKAAWIRDLAYVLNVVRRWEIAVASVDTRRMGAFAETLEQIAREGMVFASAGSELRQDITRPATTATGGEGG